MENWFEIFHESKEYILNSLALEKDKFYIIENKLAWVAWIENDLQKNFELLEYLEKEYKSAYSVVKNNEVYLGFLDYTFEKEIKKIKKRIRKLESYLPSKEKKEGKISKKDIENARNYPFEDLIPVNRAKFALCPFHNDTKPSMYVKNNFYYCFTCGARGDIIDYVMKTENLTFYQAIKRLN